MICDDCNTDADDVEETLCPYAQDITGEEVACKLCDGCYHDRCMDI